MKLNKLFLLSLLATLLLTTLPACTGQADHELAMAPLDQMPAEVQSAPVEVMEGEEDLSEEGADDTVEFETQTNDEDGSDE